MRAWLEWSYVTLPDPLDGLRLTGDAELDRAVLAGVDAVLTRRGSFQDEETDALFASRRGLTYSVFLLFGRHHPGLTFDEVRVLLEGTSDEELAGVVAKAQGRFPQTESDVELGYYRSLGLVPGSAPSRPKTLDWAKIDRNLFQNCYVLPTVVDEMTLPELSVVCQSEEEASAGSPFLVGRLYHTLTPAQLLELIRLKVARVY